MMNLVCWDDGAIPAFIELSDGNQSDKARFAELMQAFKQQWHFEGLYVADGALYSADNLARLQGIEWLSRVPLTNTIATELVEQLSDEAFEASETAGYRLAPVCTTYAGVAQRWFVIESERRAQSDLKQWHKRLAAAQRSAQAQLKRLCSVAFACEADALHAAKSLAKQWSWHRLESPTVEPRRHYAKPTQRPTLRWIFQQFMAVHVATLNGIKHITNLTPQRQLILQFMGASCRRYYLLN